MTAQRSMDGGTVSQVLLDIWIYPNLVANTILLPLLVATFLFSTRVTRHPTLINLCMTWIFSGIVSLLLFFAGNSKIDSPEPPELLCIVQASLMYGLTPMWSVAVLVFVYHMVVTTVEGWAFPGGSTVRMVMMLSAPYVAQCSFSIAALAISVSYPSPKLTLPSHPKLYCSLVYSAMCWFTFAVCVTIIAFETYLALFMYRNYRGMHLARHSTGLHLALLLRVLFFGLYILFGIVAHFVSMYTQHTYIEDMYLATMGTVVLLVFGSQADVLRVWCFWRREDRRKKPAQISLSHEPNWSIDLSKGSSPEDKDEPLSLTTTGLESGVPGYEGRHMNLGN